VVEYTFTNVVMSHTIHVTFVSCPFHYTITATSGPNGRIEPAGEVTVESGFSQTFTMVPDPGFEVDDVVVDGTSIGRTTEYTFVSVTSDHTIHVTFSRSPVALWHFDEGSGPYAGDSSGNGYGGTIYGASWTDQVAPEDGGTAALSFDGVNDWVDVPDNLSPAYITIEAWIYPTGVYDVGDHGSPILTKETGRGTPPWSESFAWRLRISPQDHKLQLQCFTATGAGGGNVSSDTALEMGRWYHVAGTYDGQNTRVYIDGQLAGSHTASVSEPLVTTNLPTAIGHLQNWSVQWFKGIIDELKVYDYARSPSQIAADGAFLIASPERGD